MQGEIYLKEGKVYFINTPNPNRPIELKYLAEVDDDTLEWFEKQEDALIFLFDNGVRKYKYLTKELSEYKSLKNLQTYELWHIGNRVGYVSYDYERYVDHNNEIQKKSICMEVHRVR